MKKYDSYTGRAMDKAAHCQGAYNEVIQAKYGHNVAATLAALLSYRDWLHKDGKLESEWFYIPWSSFTRKTDRSRSVLNTAIDTLDAAGLIDARKGSRNTSKYYKINIDRVIEAMTVHKVEWKIYCSPKTKNPRFEKDTNGEWGIYWDGALQVEPKEEDEIRSYFAVPDGQPLVRIEQPVVQNGQPVVQNGQQAVQIEQPVVQIGQPVVQIGQISKYNIKSNPTLSH